MFPQLGLKIVLKMFNLVFLIMCITLKVPTIKILKSKQNNDKSNISDTHYRNRIIYKGLLINDVTQVGVEGLALL